MNKCGISSNVICFSNFGHIETPYSSAQEKSLVFRSEDKRGKDVREAERK